MSVILAGTGCGTVETMTHEVRTAIANADLIIGAERLLKIIPSDCRSEKRTATYAKEIRDIVTETFKEKGSDHRICILYSGDSGFYSGARSLIPLLKEAGIEIKVMPGISSVQIFAARLGIPWQDWTLVSAHGTDCNAVTHVMRGRKVFFLTGGNLSPADLCAQLKSAGLGELKVIIGERLSYEDERIVTGTADELAGRDFASLSVMLAEPAPESGDLTPGISNEKFIRGTVPMTKREVRAVILSHMEIEAGNTVWDIGAGTGSVSIEMAMKANGGSVFAVECNPEGIRLMEENRSRFGTWNMTCVEGKAPEILDGLPAPDRVFIGGSKGNLKEIIEEALRKNSNALICISVIVLETLAEAVKVMAEYGMNAEIVQIAASRAKNVGTKHMMTAENPIYIISGQRSEQENTNV